MEYFNFDDVYFNSSLDNPYEISSSLDQPNHQSYSVDDSGQYPLTSTSDQGNSPTDSFNATLKFIGEILLEEEEEEEEEVVIIERKKLADLPDNHSLPIQSKDKFFHAQNQISNESNILSGGKKSRRREELTDSGDIQEQGRSNKNFAFYSGDSPPTELFDQVLLVHVDSDCDSGDHYSNAIAKGNSNSYSTKNNGPEEIALDLKTLMTRCAQAVAMHDQRTAWDYLSQLRRRATPLGDSTQRLAHYVADGLEAHLSGAKTASFSPLLNHTLSSSDILRAYEVFIAACPFFRTSFCFANSAIRKLAAAAAAKTIHVIDFGILYGFQWPGLIQRLSQRPGGPPRLRITGIEFPQRGFRPAESSEETKRRLESYCGRFGVPAECNALSRRWEDVRYEELGVEEGELVVVNCMYRMRHAAAEGPARDGVLRLIRRIRPALFVHGAVSAGYGAEPFEARFYEAVRHYAALFDMFDATVGRGDPHRAMFERVIYGRDIANVLACEGAERVERPETHLQWQERNERAGFRQVPLDQEIFEAVERTVASSYNKGFTVEQNGHWLLQGWKGQPLYALSCWKPA